MKKFFVTICLFGGIMGVAFASEPSKTPLQDQLNKSLAEAKAEKKVLEAKKTSLEANRAATIGTCTSGGTTQVDCEKKADNAIADVQAKIDTENTRIGSIESSLRGVKNMEELSVSSSEFDTNILRFWQADGADYHTRGVVGEDSWLEKISMFMIQIFGTLAVIMFMIGGGMMLIAQDDENMFNNAKNVMKSTTIAIVVFFGAYIIISTVSYVLKGVSG